MPKCVYTGRVRLTPGMEIGMVVAPIILALGESEAKRVTIQ